MGHLCQAYRISENAGPTVGLWQAVEHPQQRTQTDSCIHPEGPRAAQVLGQHQERLAHNGVGQPVGCCCCSAGEASHLQRSMVSGLLQQLWNRQQVVAAAGNPTSIDRSDLSSLATHMQKSYKW